MSDGARGGNWPEVAVTATPDTAEQLEQWLFTAGAVSVTFQDKHDQPILEPAPGEMRLWDDITLVGLFVQAQNRDELVVALHLAAGSMGITLPEYQLRELTDSVWERAWMKDYHPMQFGPRLWVCPSHRPPPSADAINIHLDPGLAFGTGTHATTAQCLSWFGRDTDNNDTPLLDQIVVDYGCGSGVLAIAAAKLGAKAVYAVDIDEQALLATRQNAVDNGVNEQLLISTPDTLQLTNADVIVANILFEPLTTLSERFGNMLSTGGTLLMSGILEEQVEELGIRYNYWFDIEPATAINGWALITATRRPT